MDPAEPPPPPPPPLVGMDDSQFLGSIIGLPAVYPPAPPPAGPKRKRGRPPKRAAAAAAAGAVVAAPPPRPPRRRDDDDEEVVCFICFDGGNLVVCDRRGCPKVYHPACIKRDEAFFQSRSKWNCGWHICSSCEKAVHYMCYTCTYSLCKVCVKQGKFFSVRGTKGFCDTCFGTILLIESKDESATKVDFDDVLSWEYLFKLYWLDLKGKLSLTLEELTSAKNRWNVPNTSARKEKEESSDDLYDVNNDDDAGSDCSSGKRRRTNSSRKRGRKRRKAPSDCSIAAKKGELPIRGAESVPMEVPKERVTLPVDTKVPNGQAPLPVGMKVPNERVPLPPDMKWASPELLEFIGHMRDGDQSFVSQFDVQTLLLEYIKKNNLRDPQRKSQIICDTRLLRLFRKARVAHFEMLNLLEMHFLMNETPGPGVNDSSQVTTTLNSAHVDTNGYSDMATKLSPDKRRRMHRKIEREPQVNLEAYAAVDMHNINLIYMRRSVMEDLIDDATFSDKVRGAFVRIKISGVGQKQDIYRLVKVVGTHKVPEKYCIGKKMTNVALEILNLDKKEIITMDTTSNQDFTEEECKRLRQSMKCGVISRLKVGDIQEKAKILQSVRVNDWFENEKQRLGHLRDRASETGRRKEFRECVEKLQLLNNSEERSRRINEVLEVHVDSHMDPDYESAEEMDDKKAVGRSVNWTRSDTSIPRRKSKYSNTMHHYPQKVSDSSHHPKSLSTESTIRGLGGRKFENSTMHEAGLLSSSGVTMSNDMEPEKVWHYKDPSGNVQGPFTLLQLSKWTSYFPRDLRVWLTFESEERSLLLTEVLSKQQKDFTQAASLASSKPTLAGTGHIMNSPSVDHTNALSPVGYSMVSSSGVPVHFNKYSVPERETVYSPDDSLSLSASSVPPKDAHTVNSHAHCQTKHSVFIQSSGSSYGHTDLHHDGIQGGCSGESNHRHSSGALWTPTMAHTSHHVSCSQCQHDCRDSSQGGSIKDLNSRRDLSKNLPTQRSGKDVSSPVFAWSPAESRTASSQHESSCLSSTNPSFLDELHSSIASAKPKSCAPATPIEDRGSSSSSGMLNHSERVPISSPHSAPSTSASDVCKMEDVVNQQRTLEVDTSNASVNQSPQSKIVPVSSPDIQDIDREFPSPTPRSENKDLVVDNLGLTPASPENATTTYSHSSNTCKIVEIASQQKTPEVVVSSSSDNHLPQSKVSPVSSPNNKDQKHECPSSTPSSENTKVLDVDNVILTSADPENLTTSAPASDICKMEESMNHQKTLEADALDAPLYQPPHSSSPSNQDIDRECASPTPKSESKGLLVDNSMSTSAAPESLMATSASASDTCKIEEFVNQHKTLEVDASDAPLNQHPDPHVFPDKQDIESECASPTPRSDGKEPLVDSSVLTPEAPENPPTTLAPASDTCKMEEILNKERTLQANASLNQPPHSTITPSSSPYNQNIECEHPCPAPRSESEQPIVDNSGLASIAHENLTSVSASGSDINKMEKISNEKRTLEADASDASLNQPSHSSIFHSPDNQDVECAHPSPTPKSESEQPLADSSGLTSIAPENLTSASASVSDVCKMEILNEKRILEADASDVSLNQPPNSSIFPSPGNQGVECEHPSPTPKSESEQPLADSSGLTSIAPENLTSASASVSDVCKMEILNEKRILEADASDVSLNQPPNSSIFPSPGNQGVECEHPSPTPRSESEQPLVDNSQLISIAPENLTSASASASDTCKMEEILNEKRTLEANPSNDSVTQSPQSKVFLGPSLDVLDIELSGTTHRPEVKEPVVDSSGLTSAAPENLTTKEPVRSQDAFVSPKSGPPIGELDTMNADFKVEEIVQKELYCGSEPTVVTRENMLIDLSCGAESIDVSDVLESLMEQSCGISYMQGTMEGFLAASAEEEPQCSSPIALSPWGEPSYYQGDAVDSALWGVQDDPINDMWSLLSPRPTLQSSSGIGTEGSGTYDINVVAVAHGNTESVQRGSVLWEENVNQTNLSAATDWMLHEQFSSIPNDMLRSSVDESTRVVGWQPSPNQSSNGVTWSTGQNLNLSSNEKAEPSSKSSWEASRKQEATNSTVSSSVEANGNTNKGLNPPSGNVNRGSQRNPHHRGRYSQISESWLLSSNQFRSRSDRFGSGGSSRSTWRGQSRD
ncbi:hypothetical protein BS78_01G508900 [Paspalum vaginatum]|nr:hypothetical protein BS78_01G508900 [Paspalum vaginatum]